MIEKYKKEEKIKSEKVINRKLVIIILLLIVLVLGCIGKDQGKDQGKYDTDENASQNVEEGTTTIVGEETEGTQNVGDTNEDIGNDENVEENIETVSYTFGVGEEKNILNRNIKLIALYDTYAVLEIDGIIYEQVDFDVENSIDDIIIIISDVNDENKTATIAISY